MSQRFASNQGCSFPSEMKEKRRFTNSNLHLEFNVCSFKDFHDAYEAMFQTARDYTVERIKLYNKFIMLESDTFSSFFARTSAQAALCNWRQDQ